MGPVNLFINFLLTDRVKGTTEKLFLNVCLSRKSKAKCFKFSFLWASWTANSRPPDGL